VVPQPGTEAVVGETARERGGHPQTGQSDGNVGRPAPRQGDEVAPVGVWVAARPARFAARWGCAAGPRNCGHGGQVDQALTNYQDRHRRRRTVTTFP
jgi:hypothetical protein